MKVLSDIFADAANPREDTPHASLRVSGVKAARVLEANDTPCHHDIDCTFKDLPKCKGFFVCDYGKCNFVPGKASSSEKNDQKYARENSPPPLKQSHCTPRHSRPSRYSPSPTLHRPPPPPHRLLHLYRGGRSSRLRLLRLRLRLHCRLDFTARLQTTRRSSASSLASHEEELRSPTPRIFIMSSRSNTPLPASRFAGGSRRRFDLQAAELRAGRICSKQLASEQAERSWFC
ncbi:hypothetical protein ACLB2K_040633 [Fragaria x ananassa]